MQIKPPIPTWVDATFSNLAASLRRFAPITLGDMNGVSLMRRIDTKYILHQDQLPTILNAVAEQYAILEIHQLRAMRYSSQYFDTPGFRFYIDHHNGKARRTKVRIRNYVDSDLSFLEVKHKSANGITSKLRTPFAPTGTNLSRNAREFIGHTVARADELRPSVHNQFRRLTLVDTDRSERVTIDWDISSRIGHIDQGHPNLVIIEVKQKGPDRHAPIMTVLKSIGARPCRVSKYCLGVACLCRHLKANRFKARLLRINAITSAAPNSKKDRHGVPFHSAF